jgi:hypothetical protein
MVWDLLMTAPMEPLQTRLDDCSEELTRLRLLLGVELSIEPLRLEASYRKETRLRAQINAAQQELDRPARYSPRDGESNRGTEEATLIAE